MPSKAQRAVTGVPPERWAQLGKALQEWREDELGYQVRGHFAADRYINIRLIQDLEKNYRPGTYTKWALQDAAQAYKVTYESVLAFLDGKVDALARDEGAPARPLSGTEVADLPPSPFYPDRTDADHPYALTIWNRYLDLPRRVTDPTGAQMFGEGTDDARAWDSIAAYGVPVEDLVWALADLHRRAADRAADRAGTPEANSHGA